MSTVLLSGASGFIGSHLTKSLSADGHRVVRLARAQSRSAPGVADSIRWDPEGGDIDRDALAKLRPDAVVNLAGESIAKRWTAKRRRHIRDSRIKGTTVLAEALASLPQKPSVFVSGSAMGYYGARRGDELLDENSTPGSDFLAEIARDWERATEAASRGGIRVVLPRTGIVLGKDGGALRQMLPPFRLGVGGKLGSGKQWMSWVALDDVVRALRFFIDTSALRGPVNLVAPDAVRNEEFTRVLGRVLGRPAIMPVPAFALELLFGTMADNTILASQHMVPKKLAGAGFEFRHPRLEEALRFELRR